MKLFTIFFLCGHATLANSVFCSRNMTLREVPRGVLAQIITVATRGTVATFVGCSSKHEIDRNKIRFWLYDKERHNVPVSLDHDNPAEIDPQQKIVFIIHGWTCNITGYGLPEMKNAFLKRYPNANIILIEWTTYSVDLYTNAFCHIPLISEVIGKFICNLNSNFSVDISQIHLVGHSMGAQISGLTGQVTQSLCNRKIGRITGLDPAGPLYRKISPARRLDASDAILVDVIHTNQGQFGFYGTCGTVDYFPNCGYTQPGCRYFKPISNIRALLNSTLRTVICSHFRSIELFNESLLGSCFLARSCKLCPGIPPVGPCKVDPFRASTSVMGEDHTKFASTDPKYFLKTTGRAPFVKDEYECIVK